MFFYEFPDLWKIFRDEILAASLVFGFRPTLSFLLITSNVPNEVILISGFVNYPGHEKLLLLKQLETMAKTIYKGELQ